VSILATRQEMAKTQAPDLHGASRRPGVGRKMKVVCLDRAVSPTLRQGRMFSRAFSGPKRTRPVV
jgi:hypothetical protein